MCVTWFKIGYWKLNDNRPLESITNTFLEVMLCDIIEKKIVYYRLKVKQKLALKTSKTTENSWLFHSTQTNYSIISQYKYNLMTKYEQNYEICRVFCSLVQATWLFSYLLYCKQCIRSPKCQSEFFFCSSSSSWFLLYGCQIRCSKFQRRVDLNSYAGAKCELFFFWFVFRANLISLYFIDSVTWFLKKSSAIV